MKDYPSESMEMKPHLSLTDRDLPAIKSWEVGKKYTIVATVMEISKSEEQYEDKKSSRASFEVLDVKQMRSKPKEKSYSDDDVKVALDMEKLNFLR